MTESDAPFRVGVDVGGTFTDVVCARDGQPPLVFKVPSTPANPGEAALAAVERLAAEGVEPGSLAQLAHGTTVATNAVLERTGGRLGIITTEGFRDTLEIGRQMRREMYEVRLDPQTPVFLAPRAMRIGVRERVGPGGEVIEPLDEDSVRAALDRLVAAGAECIAVCLLFSFINPEHERRVREIAVRSIRNSRSRCRARSTPRSASTSAPRSPPSMRTSSRRCAATSPISGSALARPGYPPRSR